MVQNPPKGPSSTEKGDESVALGRIPFSNKSMFPKIGVPLNHPCYFWIFHGATIGHLHFCEPLSSNHVG